jgi:hypothetical protein
MTKTMPGLLLLSLAGCAAHERLERQAFTGFREQGHGPGIELGVLLVGDRVESGTFTLFAPEGMEDMGGPSRLVYPMLEIVQAGTEASFRVDLQVGTGVRPFRFSARLVAQEDGTIHAYLHQHDASGRPAEYTGPPIALKRIDSEPSNKTPQPTGAPSGAGGSAAKRRWAGHG